MLFIDRTSPQHNAGCVRVDLCLGLDDIEWVALVEPGHATSDERRFELDLSAASPGASLA